MGEKLVHGNSVDVNAVPPGSAQWPLINKLPTPQVGNVNGPFPPLLLQTCQVTLQILLIICKAAPQAAPAGLSLHHWYIPVRDFSITKEADSTLL